LCRYPATVLQQEIHAATNQTGEVDVHPVGSRCDCPSHTSAPDGYLLRWPVESRGKWVFKITIYPKHPGGDDLSAAAWCRAKREAGLHACHCEIKTEGPNAEQAARIKRLLDVMAPLVRAIPWFFSAEARRVRIVRNPFPAFFALRAWAALSAPPRACDVLAKLAKHVVKSARVSSLLVRRDDDIEARITAGADPLVRDEWQHLVAWRVLDAQRTETGSSWRLRPILGLLCERGTVALYPALSDGDALANERQFARACYLSGRRPLVADSQAARSLSQDFVSLRPAFKEFLFETLKPLQHSPWFFSPVSAEAARTVFSDVVDQVYETFTHWMTMTEVPSVTFFWRSAALHALRLEARNGRSETAEAAVAAVVAGSTSEQWKSVVAEASRMNVVFDSTAAPPPPPKPIPHPGNPEAGIFFTWGARFSVQVYASLLGGRASGTVQDYTRGGARLDAMPSLPSSSEGRERALSNLLVACEVVQKVPWCFLPGHRFHARDNPFANLCAFAAKRPDLLLPRDAADSLALAAVTFSLKQSGGDRTPGGIEACLCAGVADPDAAEWREMVRAAIDEEFPPMRGGTIFSMSIDRIAHPLRPCMILVAPHVVWDNCRATRYQNELAAAKGSGLHPLRARVMLRQDRDFEQAKQDVMAAASVLRRVPWVFSWRTEENEPALCKILVDAAADGLASWAVVCSRLARAACEIEMMCTNADLLSDQSIGFLLQDHGGERALHPPAADFAAEWERLVMQELARTTKAWAETKRKAEAAQLAVLTPFSPEEIKKELDDVTAATQPPAPLEEAVLAPSSMEVVEEEPTALVQPSPPGAAPSAPAPVEEEKPGDCVICLDVRSSVRLSPCMHLCLCRACFNQVLTRELGCPLCRGKVAGRVPAQGEEAAPKKTKDAKQACPDNNDDKAERARLFWETTFGAPHPEVAQGLRYVPAHDAQDHEPFDPPVNRGFHYPTPTSPQGDLVFSLPTFNIPALDPPASDVQDHEPFDPPAGGLYGEVIAALESLSQDRDPLAGAQIVRLSQGPATAASNTLAGERGTFFK
jgi:hypothetical protein